MAKRVLDEHLEGGGYAEDTDAMGANGYDDPSSVGESPVSEQVRKTFVSDIYRPVFRLATHDYEEALGLIEDLKFALTMLGSAIEPMAGPSSASGAVADSKASAPAAASPHPAAAMSAASGQLGRNQRSKIRELVMLEFLDRADRPCARAEIMDELGAHGLDSSSSAVVSHLHRLKDLDIIVVTGSGMYRLSQTGPIHLKELRRAYGQFKPPRR